jgi:hypothetical protein
MAIWEAIRVTIPLSALASKYTSNLLNMRVFASFFVVSVSYHVAKQRKRTDERSHKRENNGEWCLVSLCGRNCWKMSVRNTTFYLSEATNLLTKDNRTPSFYFWCNKWKISCMKRNSYFTNKNHQFSATFWENSDLTVFEASHQQTTSLAR